MRRSRAAVVLVLCTLSACLVAVSFADGQSCPFAGSATALGNDLDQLYDDWSPNDVCCDEAGGASPADALDASALTTVEKCRPELFERIALWVRSWPFTSPAAAADAIARALSRRAQPQCGGPVSFNEFDCEITADECPAASTAGCDQWPIPWAVASDETVSDGPVSSGDAGNTLELIEALSIVWGVTYDDVADDDGGEEISADTSSDEYAQLAADPRHSQGNDIAVALNVLGQGLPYSSDLNCDLALDLAMQWIRPWPLWSISLDFPAASDARPAALAEDDSNEGYQCLWIGCEAFPDASTAGWQKDAGQAGNVAACREVCSIVAGAAGRLARDSQAAMTSASQHLLNWLILSRFEQSAPTLSSPTFPAPRPAQDAYHGARGCFVL